MGRWNLCEEGHGALSYQASVLSTWLYSQKGTDSRRIFHDSAASLCAFKAITMPSVASSSQRGRRVVKLIGRRAPPTISMVLVGNLCGSYKVIWFWRHTIARKGKCIPRLPDVTSYKLSFSLQCQASTYARRREDKLRPYTNQNKRLQQLGETPQPGARLHDKG